MADRSIPAPPALLLPGVGMGTIEAGRVIMTLEPGGYHYNPPGIMHGGMIATLLDSVMGCAVRSMLPAGHGYTTLEFKVNFVRPVGDRTGVMTAEEHAVHGGRRWRRLLDAAGKLYATASRTCLVFDVPG